MTLYGLKDVRRTVLLSKAAECRKKLSTAREGISVETAPEAMEHSLRAAERELAVEEMESAYCVLRQVESALSRLERGKYAVCLKCGERISEKRLDALPWAAYCVRCQEGVDALHQGVRELLRNEYRRAA